MLCLRLGDIPINYVIISGWWEVGMSEVWWGLVTVVMTIVSDSGSDGGDNDGDDDGWRC